MNDLDNYQEEDINTALLDADLFIQYNSPAKAIKVLQDAVEKRPRSVELRERIRSIAIKHELKTEAARQCLALASLYLGRQELDKAHDRLLEAKQLDQRVNITTGLEAIRRMRNPTAFPPPPPRGHSLPEQSRVAREQKEREVSFAGDLSIISIFDIVQVIENSRLTGLLSISKDKSNGSIFFNQGSIVGATLGQMEADKAFKSFIELTEGRFDFNRSESEYPVTINCSSNTQLILDSLREIDENKRDEFEGETELNWETI
jgi:tetratricopeptide (TPR) repeat protein